MSGSTYGSDYSTSAASGGVSPGYAPRGHVPLSSTAAARQAFPKQLSEKYRLGEELGRGAYGRVYRGLDARTGEQVAVKQISIDRIPTAALASLVTEVELLKALNHCNVVQYFGSFRSRTHLYIIMELVENGSLAAVIKTQQFGPFPEALVGMYIQQVLQGLAYLHDQGVVHRDIKGANILTTKDGVVKLADFGVAARLGDSTGTGGTGSTTKDGVDEGEETEPAGTPYWMAPEVIELKTVTTASDIWSVGCLAVELLTGQPPYFDLQPMSALYNIVQNPHPPLPPGASPSMQDFLLQCFRKDPASRPSAKTLLQHPWVLHNRRNLKSTWLRGGTQPKEGVHVSVASAVQRVLEDESRPASVDSRGGSETASPKHGVASGAVNSSGVVDSASEFSGIGHTLPAESIATQAEYIRQVDEDTTGSNLLAALADLSMKENGAGGSTALEGGGSAPQDEAEVRRQAASLRIISPGERSIIEEAAAAASARTLVGYLSDSPSLRRLFISIEGLCGIRELLDSSSDRVLGPAMDLLLALTIEDSAAMEMACAMGLIPAALRLSGPSHPPELRLRAARLATALARSSQGGAHMLVACQGVPFFITMMDDLPQSPEQLDLLRSAAGGFWALLHRSLTPGWPLSTNAYLRLMTHHGLPHRLVKAMPWVLKLASSERSTHHSRSVSVPKVTRPPSLGAVRPAYTNTGYASSNEGSGRYSIPGSEHRVLRPNNRVVPEDLIGVGASVGVGVGPGYAGPPEPPSSDSQLLDSLVGLFAVLSHGDAVVKARCCALDCINPIFGFTVRMPTHLQVCVLQAVRRFSMEQSVLDALEAANGVAYVVAQITRADVPELQIEALNTLYNLCQLKRSRQEATAVAGAVPWLLRQALHPPAAPSSSPAEVESARSAAVAVLCLLAHCSPSTRAELWGSKGLEVFLQLLKEDAHQVMVLEALASWLDAELPRIESDLLEGTALTRLVLVLSHQANQDQLPSVLSPLGRMLARSPRLAVNLASAGLATRVVELLRRPTPPAALALMDILQLLYEAHPHPKEFLAQNRVGPALAALAQGAQAGDQVLVRTRANNLLQAFNVNAVF